MCRLLGVSRQAIYQRIEREHENLVDEDRILIRVRSIRSLQPRIGARKLYDLIRPAELGRDRFIEVLRHRKMLVKPRKRFVPTTNSRHGLPVEPNLIKGKRPTGPNQVVVADQTYLRLRRGFCYLSLVTDLWSRKILGYDVSPTLEAKGPLRALQMALSASRRGFELHHSDRGAQYCSKAYKQLLEIRAVARSMSAPGCPYENAVAERVNGILKSEFYLDLAFGSLQEVSSAVRQTIWVYNTLRPHLSLGMRTPDEVHGAN